MQVGRAALDGIQQHLVDETYYRCVVRFCAGILLGGLVRATDIQSLEVDIVEACETVGSAFEQLVDGQAKLVVFDQNRFGRQAGAELDIIDGLVVGGVGDAYKELVAAPPQRDDPVLADQLFADGVPRKAFLVQAIQVAIGDAELLGGQFGQGQAAYQLALHQVRHQRQLVALRLRLGLHGGLFVE